MNFPRPKILATTLILLLAAYGVACSGDEDRQNDHAPDAGLEDTEDNGGEFEPCEDESCFAELAAGEHHSCALDGEGSIHCWGSNEYQQSDAPSGEFMTISAGGRITCGIDPTNVVHCWRLGEVTTEQYYSAVSVGDFWSDVCRLEVDTSEVDCNGHAIPDGTVFKQVSSGFLYSCGVNPEGNIECFVDEDVFDGPSSVPAADPPDGTFSYVSAAANHTCAIDDEGAIECWGSDAGHIEEVLIPPAGTFVDLSLGQNFGCAIDDEHGIECWGDNDEGALDAPEGRFLEVEAGGPFSHHVCAIDETHQIQCWGNDDYGQASPPATP